MPQARAGLLPNITGGADSSSIRTKLDEPSAVINRTGTVYRATLSQPIFRADRWFQLQTAKDDNEPAVLELSSIYIRFHKILCLQK